MPAIRMFDADALVENISRFTSLSSGIVKGIEMRRDGKWGQRLMKDRAALAEVMDGFMERAPKELAAALPLGKSGSFAGGPKYPDFSRPVDAEKIERALRYARLVIGCKPFAAAASFGASVKKAEEDMCQMLRSYNEDVVKRIAHVRRCAPHRGRKPVRESSSSSPPSSSATKKPNSCAAAAAPPRPPRRREARFNPPLEGGSRKYCSRFVFWSFNKTVIPASFTRLA